MRRRLLASYLALTFVVLIVLEVPLAIGYGDRERQQITTGLQRDAFMIANYSEETLEGDAHAPIQQYVDRYARRTGSGAVVVDARGHVVAASAGAPTGTSVGTARPELGSALRGRATNGSVAGRDNVMYAAVPVSSSGDVTGAVRITYDSDKVDGRIHRYWLVLIGAGIVTLGAAALVGILLSRWVTQPLVPLRQAATRLGHGDLSARVGRGAGPSEVREVSEAFDEMAERLEELVGAQVAFVADASHQLRTPLTALRLRLENLECEIDDPEALDDVAGARQETQRLSRLVDGLITLARADRTVDGADRERIDIDAITAARLDVWRPIADEYDVDLVSESSALDLWASPDRVAQVLDNLLANATDASPPGSRLSVVARGSPDGRWVELHVVDQGPGLDPEQRQHAFDRFWRADNQNGEDRSSRSNLGGSGLGLAIVHRLVTADGGRVELRAAPGGGIDAVASYPVGPPPIATWTAVPPRVGPEQT